MNRKRRAPRSDFRLMANTDSDIDLLPLFHFMLQIQTNGVVEKVFELAERNFMRFASAINGSDSFRDGLKVIVELL